MLATEKRFGGACQECCWDLDDGGEHSGACRYCGGHDDGGEAPEDSPSESTSGQDQVYWTPGAPLSETELVRLAQQMDERALSALFNSYYPRIYAYGLAQLRNVPAAEDFASDVILRMIDGIKRYECRNRPFSAWIFRIARNRLIDLQRQRRRFGESPLDEGADYGSNSGSRAIAQLLDAEMIQEGLSHLTASQAQVIVLRFLQDLDLPTAATVLGRSERAIKSLQFRAVSALREVMAGMEHASGAVSAGRTSAPVTTL